MNEYNRALYNRKIQPLEISTTYDMASSMTALFAIGPKINIEYQDDGAMTAQANLGWCYIKDFDFDSEMSMEATARCAYFPNGVWEGSLDADIEWMLDLYANFAASGWITARARASAYFTPNISASGWITARFRPQRTYWPNWELMSSMTADFEAIQIVEQVMAFPGLRLNSHGTLVIDGPGYNVTLNGANVLNQYEGEWLTVDRNIRSLEADSPTSGNLTVTIRYQEMFL